MNYSKPIFFSFLFFFIGISVFSQVTTEGNNDSKTFATANIYSWNIDPDHRTGQKLPMRLIYPRPDAETPLYALHRKASSKWTYKTRICIQGGEAPFKYELISGPASATIVGETDRTQDPVTGLISHKIPTDYATVFWTNPSNAGTFYVKVTDQSGAVTDVKWTVQTDESAFVILDQENGNDANAGTWNSPLASIPEGLWKNSDTDATYANKIAVFKKGTYPVYSTAYNTDCSINAGVKPRSFLAVENGVVFDTNGGHFYVNTGNVAFVGIEFRGSKTNVENNRIIQVSEKDSNYLFWNLKFSNQTDGTVANDNPSCIVFMDDNVYSHNIAVVDCELLPTSAIQLICTFACDGILVENNKVTNVNQSLSNGSTFIHIKDDSKNVTVRFNQLSGKAPSGMIRMSNQQHAGMLAFNQEVCYNFLKSDIIEWEAGLIIWNQNATETNNASNTHCYRNTIVCPNFAISTRSWNGGDKVKLSGNAYVSANFLFGGVGYEETAPVNVKLLATDLNSDGTINNSAGKRALYAGKNGFEILSIQDPVLSVTTNTLKKFNVYPNPWKDKNLTIEGLDDSSNTIIKILNLQGQLLYQTQTKSDDFKIDRSILKSSGTYILCVSQNSRTETFKIMVP
ncbi:T9SS type A sorting domain-containing protein [Flavobacterium sp. LM4]|uniref:T9SS type A sorting domain-containing protein n=1 Tax=Flavobacterium sp. LM4 TaxID=1938609 RepID=UPI000993F4FE|nr:T9SS type A sorting domain-containing protein [Flavobacterium sp. LM4]OOV16505.1 hypothetical protein BXU10_20315 [Flavobacterium sp. LM4]